MRWMPFASWLLAKIQLKRASDSLVLPAPWHVFRWASPTCRLTLFEEQKRLDEEFETWRCREGGLVANGTPLMPPTEYDHPFQGRLADLRRSIPSWPIRRSCPW